MIQANAIAVDKNEVLGLCNSLEDLGGTNEKRTHTQESVILDNSWVMDVWNFIHVETDFTFRIENIREMEHTP